MMEEWKIQNIFSKCQKRKFWNIFLPKNLANDLLVEERVRTQTEDVVISVVRAAIGRGT